MTSLARWARAALVAVLLATGLGAALGAYDSGDYYLHNRYGASPAFYRDAAHGNRAAFYVFESLRIADWSALEQVRATSIVLAQTTNTALVNGFGGMYTYDAIAGNTAPGWAEAHAYCKANGLVWAPSIGPGYGAAAETAYLDRTRYWVDRYRPGTPQPHPTVSLRARVNNRYVTAEAGGAQPLIANRDAVGPWEQSEHGMISGP